MAAMASAQLPLEHPFPKLKGPPQLGAVVALLTLGVYRKVKLPVEVEVVDKGGGNKEDEDLR